jgi:SOS-response transcriptional repressor LexA
VPRLPESAQEPGANHVKALTPRQREALDFIVGFVREHGYSPTIREIGAQLGIRSTNGVMSNLLCLQRKGAIDLERNHLRRGRSRSRNIVLLRRTPRRRIERDSVAATATGTVDLPRRCLGCGACSFDRPKRCHLCNASCWSVEAA